MGQAALQVLNALSCQDWARYVCNSMHIHSRCMDCCELDVETDQVSIPSSSSSEPCCLSRTMGIDIKPIKTQAYEWKQSPSLCLPRCPFRMIISGPSATGKGLLTHNLLLSPECYMGLLRANLQLQWVSKIGSQLARHRGLRRA